MALVVDVINENYKISISFVNTGEKLDRNSLIINNEFAFLTISRKNLDIEPMNIMEC